MKFILDLIRDWLLRCVVAVVGLFLLMTGLHLLGAGDFLLGFGGGCYVYGISHYYAFRL